MAQYNLNRNYSLTTLVGSGYGNRSLTWGEKDLLIDEDTTSSGVSILYTDSLWLQTDLTDQIKVDEVRLYIYSTSISGAVLDAINFYYSNDSLVNFLPASKYISSFGYYYCTIPAPSAPRYVRVTISGIDATLYEYEILNDEYLVGFGNDGNLYRKYLEKTTIGIQGSPTLLPIFNNSVDLDDPPIDAYICVDYSGNAGDYYLKISSSENGTYYGLDDGGVLEDDEASSTLRWSYGVFDNTVVDNNNVALSADTVDYYINDVPLVNTVAYGWDSTSNCWVWHREENRIFCMGSDSGPQLKLWEYFLESNSFVFKTLLNPGGPTDHKYRSSMTYIDGKVYVCVNNDGKFGYYDINGPINNWTSLSDIPETLTYVDDKIVIISDQERYIYALCADSLSATVPAAHGGFFRYDTVSGTTWTTLNNSFRAVYSSTSWGVTPCLTYDYDRNCIYLISSDIMQPASTASDWIQKYDIASDTWFINFFRLADYFTTTQRHRAAISYNRNRIYLWMNVTPLYYVDLFTFTVKTELSDFKQASGTEVPLYILAIDSPTNPDDTIVLCTPIYASYRKICGSNMYTDGGTYVTPIFELANKYMASYFVVENTTDEYSNISWDQSVRNGIVKYRSSDTPPLPLMEYYWPYKYSNTLRISKRDLFTNTVDDVFINTATTYWSWSSIAVNNFDGTIAVSMLYTYGSTYKSQIRFYNRSGTQTYSSISDIKRDRSFSKMVFDNSGGIWAYNDVDNKLLHFNSSLVLQATLTLVGSSELLDFTNCNYQDGIWYIFNDKLYLTNYYGTVATLTLTSPQCMCNSDGGVWVVDAGNYVYNYINSGNKIIKPSSYITLSKIASYIADDKNGGFWYSDGHFVSHVNGDGLETSYITFADTIDFIHGGQNGCIAYSSISGKLFFINLDGVLTNTFSYGAYWEDLFIYPFLFSYTLNDFYNGGGVFMPLSYDPVWKYPGGSLEWEEMVMNGKFLPKNKYHQLHFNFSTRSDTHIPSIDKIILAPAIKLSGIPSQSSKNIYIKTDISTGADIKNYETKLKAWWTVIND